MIATDHPRPGAGRRHLFAAPADAELIPDSPLAPRWSALVIRLAVAADETSLRRLAHLDSARPLSGPTLLAEQDGSLAAALSLDDGAAIADPFTASGDAVAMLRVRAAQLNRNSTTAA